MGRTAGALRQILAGSNGPVFALAFSPDDKMLASGGELDNTVIRLWDVQTGKLERTLKWRRVNAVKSDSFFPRRTDPSKREQSSRRKYNTTLERADMGVGSSTHRTSTGSDFRSFFSRWQNTGEWRLGPDGEVMGCTDWRI